MNVVLGWFRDPLIHVILLGLALVYGFSGSQREEMRQAPAQPVLSLGEEEEGVIQDMSPPIVTRARETGRHD
jgi:hypothetical protein